MIDFFHMSDKDMILLSAAIALLLIDGLDADRQNTLANFLMTVGQNVSSASGQKALYENKIKEIKEIK